MFHVRSSVCWAASFLPAACMSFVQVCDFCLCGVCWYDRHRFDCFRTGLLAFRCSLLLCACCCPGYVCVLHGLIQDKEWERLFKSAVADTLGGCTVESSVAFFSISFWPVCAVGLLFPGVSYVQDF